MLTILTPTYNRGKLLGKLYDSLKKQTDPNFIWVIVDDGSIDKTSETVQKFIAEDVIRIEYYKKRNGGKHTAINYAVPLIHTKLTFIVDSDDTLTEDAVQNILFYEKKYAQYKELCGFAFLKAHQDGTVSGKVFEQNEIIESYVESRINRKDTRSDKAEVFYTSCLREYPFPEFEGERFLSEDVVWIRMAMKYKLVNINKVIYLFEYIEDGLTKNLKKIKAKNPLGEIERSKELMNKACIMRCRVKGALLYNIYSNYARLKGIRRENKKAPCILCSLLRIPSYLIYLVWRKKYYEAS